MLWVKSLHVIFMVTWFAGLFYLPRIFVYHALCNAEAESAARDAQSATFKVMERKLMIMTHIGAALTTLFGAWLLVGWLSAFLNAGWMHAKLALVALLYFYHFLCWRLVHAFRDDRNARSHVWYRYFNELPVLALVGIVMLVIVKPF